MTSLKDEGWYVDFNGNICPPAYLTAADAEARWKEFIQNVQPLPPVEVVEDRTLRDNGYIFNGPPFVSLLSGAVNVVDILTIAPNLVFAHLPQENQ